MKRVIFWGATGQSLVLYELLSNQGYIIDALFDNNSKITSPIANVQLYHKWDGFAEWLKTKNPKKYCFAVAIGGYNGRVRIDIHNRLKGFGLIPINSIHNEAYLATDAIHEEGLQMLPKSVIGSSSKLGICCIINTSAHIDHECILGNGVHVAPGAHLAGCVHIGDYSFIGTGSTILPRIVIGKNSIIGAGSVVTRNIPDNVVAYGNPARIIKSNE